jgi:hypothetical protein
MYHEKQFNKRKLVILGIGAVVVVIGIVSCADTTPASP